MQTDGGNSERLQKWRRKPRAARPCLLGATVNACKSGGESPGPQGPVHWEARLCPPGNHAGAAAGRRDGGAVRRWPWPPHNPLAVCLFVACCRTTGGKRGGRMTGPVTRHVNDWAGDAACE
eukprot:COSAG01_NODE_7111_length_3346_cov_78.626116_5_plen_121_part_00